MALTIPEDDPIAIAVVAAIHAGDVDRLKQMLHQQPSLAAAYIECGDGVARSLLHVATDWPGDFPNNVAVVVTLVKAGADVNARNPPYTETPLHWAASSDSVQVVDALLDAGAAIDSPGAVIAGGTPLDDAVAFGQWQAARRLVERGARTAPWHAAAVGLMERLEAHFGGSPAPSTFPWGAEAATPPDDLTVSFWCACHGGRQPAAAYLLERGADLNWISVWDELTPLDAAVRAGADELAAWLRDRGAKSATELSDR